MLRDDKSLLYFIFDVPRFSFVRRTRSVLPRYPLAVIDSTVIRLVECNYDCTERTVAKRGIVWHRAWIDLKWVTIVYSLNIYLLYFVCCFWYTIHAKRTRTLRLYERCDWFQDLVIYIFKIEAIYNSMTIECDAKHTQKFVHDSGIFLFVCCCCLPILLPRANCESANSYFIFC